MPTWIITTKLGDVLEGDDSPFSLVDVNDIMEFTYVPKNIKIKLSDGQRLIYFKRHRYEMKMFSKEKPKKTTSIFVGFQETKNGKNIKSVTEIDKDGKMNILTDDNRKGD